MLEGVYYDSLCLSLVGSVKMSYLLTLLSVVAVGVVDGVAVGACVIRSLVEVADVGWAVVVSVAYFRRRQFHCALDFALSIFLTSMLFLFYFILFYRKTILACRATSVSNCLHDWITSTCCSSWAPHRKVKDGRPNSGSLQIRVFVANPPWPITTLNLNHNTK